jgi:hypothetical protein
MSDTGLIIGSLVLCVLATLAFLYFVPGTPPEGIYDFVTMKGVVIHPTEKNKHEFVPNPGDAPGFIIYYYGAQQESYLTNYKEVNGEPVGHVFKAIVYSLNNAKIYRDYKDTGGSITYNRLLRGFNTPFGLLKRLSDLPPRSATV